MDVLVLEAQPEPGGAVKSAELFPGYVSDLFSAFYPLSAVSPALHALGPQDHELRWSPAPLRSADDEDAPLIFRNLERAVAGLDQHHRGDGGGWAALSAQWQTIRKPLLSALFAPLPPARGVLGTAAPVRHVLGQFRSRHELQDSAPTAIQKPPQQGTGFRCPR
jgi:phytoene dehydrogenase-like protein